MHLVQTKAFLAVEMEVSVIKQSTMMIMMVMMMMMIVVVVGVTTMTTVVSLIMTMVSNEKMFFRRSCSNFLCRLSSMITF